jgi:hypothetical protein
MALYLLDTTHWIIWIMTTNIIVFTPEEADGCSWYRSFGVLGFLPDVQIHRANTVTWATFANMDIAFFQRPYNRKHLMVVELAKQMGCKVWVDYDDLLTEVPRSNPAHDIYKDNCVHTLVRIADIITTSTNGLAARLARCGTDVKINVIPNAYNDFVLPTKFERLTHLHPIVMWRGTKSHQGDLSAYANQLSDTIHTYPETEFTFVGYDPWMIDHSGNMTVHDTIPLFGYFNFLIDSAPDILIVPLEDNAFNLCKSNIAQLEVARCGATVIGPSWLQWDRELTHMVYYDHCKDLSSAIQRAKDERAEMSEDDLRARWEDGLDRNRLSKVNELRTEVIEELLP